MNVKFGTVMRKAAMAAALVATAATGMMATTAEARPGWGGGWHGGYHRGGGAGAVIAGGIVGAALGAAIVDSSRPRYYYPAGYGYAYAPPPPPPPYYYGGYYRPWAWHDGYYWDHWGHRYYGHRGW